MTNGEKFKTAQERTEAFIDYCEHCWEPQCTVREMVYCFADWLELEAKVEKIQPCYMCGSKRITSYKADVGYSLLCRDCGYCAGTADTREEIENKHNRVAKAVKEIEVTK